jgi:hypothetical protein
LFGLRAQGEKPGIDQVNVLNRQISKRFVVCHECSKIDKRRSGSQFLCFNCGKDNQADFYSVYMNIVDDAKLRDPAPEIRPAEMKAADVDTRGSQSRCAVPSWELGVGIPDPISTGQ